MNRAISLFSGLGSFALACRDNGFAPLCHDSMKEAVASLEANGFLALCKDVREVDFTSSIYLGTKLVVGGPPCQPFSQSGRNGGETDGRDMIPDFQRCVAQTLPEVFILENVKNLAGPKHRAYLETRISEFEAIGYRVEHRVLNCAEYGVAQARRRLFVIGVRADLARSPQWPAPSLEQTMAAALGWDAATCVERNLLAPVPAHDPHLALWPLSQPSTTVVASFRPEVQAAPGYRRAGDGPRQNAPGSVVTTSAERLVLQGLPADWVVAGSKSKVDLQIGNTVPNPVVHSLIKENS